MAQIVALDSKTLVGISFVHGCFYTFILLHKIAELEVEPEMFSEHPSVTYTRIPYPPLRHTPLVFARYGIAQVGKNVCWCMAFDGAETQVANSGKVYNLWYSAIPALMPIPVAI